MYWKWFQMLLRIDLFIVLIVQISAIHKPRGLNYPIGFNLNNINVYYDPSTGIPFRMISIENSLTNLTYYHGDGASIKGGLFVRRVTFKSNGCDCREYTCGCCLGLNLFHMNFNGEGCMNFTYIPSEFGLEMAMTMDGNTFFHYTLSGKNPPPICLPVPIPYIPLAIQACAKLYNLYTYASQFHFCFNFETRIQSVTILVLQFDCMTMGSDGVTFSKPTENEIAPIVISSTSSSITPPTVTQIDSSIYNEVTEVKFKAKKLFK